MNFSLGRCCLELAQTLSCVALAWHEAGGSTPFGVTSLPDSFYSDGCRLSNGVEAKTLRRTATKIADPSQNEASLRKGQ